MTAMTLPFGSLLRRASELIRGRSARPRRRFRPSAIGLERFEDRIVPTTALPYYSSYYSGTAVTQTTPITFIPALNEAVASFHYNATTGSAQVGIAVYQATSPAGQPVTNGGLLSQTYITSDVVTISPAHPDATVFVTLTEAQCKGILQFDTFSGPVITNFASGPIDGHSDFYDLRKFEGIVVDYTDVCETNPGGVGLSPGFWKNHTSSWPAPYTPTTTLGSVFAGLDSTVGNMTFLDALQTKGMSNKNLTPLQNAELMLLREGVAGLLNATAFPGLAPSGYPLTPSQLILAVDAAISTGDQATIQALASTLDVFNNLEGVTLG